MTERRKLLLPILVGAAIIEIFLMNIPSADAQERTNRCGQHADVTQWLKDGYEEQPVFEGVTKHQLLIQAFASKESRTWTILMTRPDGISCLVFAGTDFELINIFQKDQGEGA